MCRKQTKQNQFNYFLNILYRQIVGDQRPKRKWGDREEKTGKESKEKSKEEPQEKERK